jgi:ClpP class serine protease
MDWIFLVFMVIFFLMAVQPAMAQRRLRTARHGKILELEHELKSRIITLIHRQERPNIFGQSSARYIDIEDAQTVIEAIQTTPKGQPISLILHTPGGLVLAATQIARAIQAHPAPVTIYVPFMAMSGGTLLALAADQIVMDEFAVMGPIDPQIAGLPAASIANVKNQKQASDIHDLTLVFADISEKAIAQITATAASLLAPRMGQEHAEALAHHLSSGVWTHDHPISPEEASGFGLSVSTDLPISVKHLMAYYPQPVRQIDSVESSPPQSRQIADFTRLIWGDWAK